MIGSGLKKLAKANGMTVGNGIAYGALQGFATALFEGAGYKQINISTKFPSPEQQVLLQNAVNAVDLQKQYRVQNLGISDKGISVVFMDNPGTMKKIEAFVEWFYPLLKTYEATGYQVCMDCGSDVTAGSWYLIGGFACYLHDSCADRIAGAMEQQEQERKDSDTGSYVQGLLGALLGAVLGSIVWGLVLSLGYVASLVGLLIGWLAEKGYTLLHGKQGKGKVWILLLSVVVGVALGTFLPSVFELVGMMNAGELPGFGYGDIPSLILLVLQEDSEYAGAIMGNGVMGLLFALLGSFGLLRKTGKEVTGEQMKKLS